jgi:hypothetical protein
MTERNTERVLVDPHDDELQLRELIAVARAIYADSHITLGHALHLAKLTAVDQDRAVRWMLNGTGDYAKLSTEGLLAARLENLVLFESAANKRLVDKTEGELKAWIAESHKRVKVTCIDEAGSMTGVVVEFLEGRFPKK